MRASIAASSASAASCAYPPTACLHTLPQRRSLTSLSAPVSPVSAISVIPAACLPDPSSALDHSQRAEPLPETECIDALAIPLPANVQSSRQCVCLCAEMLNKFAQSQVYQGEAICAAVERRSSDFGLACLWQGFA